MMLDYGAARVTGRAAGMGLRHRADALAAGVHRAADVVDQLFIDDAAGIARVEPADLVLLDASRPADGCSRSVVSLLRRALWGRSTHSASRP